LTSALWPQASHVAVTARTPFWRMFANVMGGPGLLRMACACLMEEEVQGGQEGGLYARTAAPVIMERHRVMIARSPQP
jgi:hypothetical protein